MRRFKLFLAIVLTLLLVSITLPSAAQGPTGVPVRRIVVFEGSALNEPAREALVRQFGGVVIKHLPLVSGMAVLLPPPSRSGPGPRAGGAPCRG